MQVDKVKREQEAADMLFALLPKTQAAQYRTLWEEFDAAYTSDAVYANAIDRLQSFNNIYKSGGVAWIKFNATAKRVETRMLPVKQVLPDLWPFVEDAMACSIKRGWILP